MKFHQTGLEVAGNCLFAYQKEELERPDEAQVQPVAGLAVGSAFHEFDQEYARHCRATRQGTDLAYAEELVATFADRLSPDDYEDLAEVVEAYVHQGPSLVLAEASVEDQVAVTAKGEPTTKDAADCWLYGTVDRWWLQHSDNGDILHIRDRKTNRRIWPASEAQNRLQLPLYAGMLVSRFKGRADGFTPTEIRGAYDFVRYGVSRQVDLSWAIINKAIQRAKRVASQIEQAAKAKEWPARPGCEHCAWCRVKAICPAKEELCRRFEIVNAVTAAQAAKFLSYIEAQAQTIKDQLKAYVEAQGPVDDGEGTTWSFITQKTMEFDARRVFNFLEAGAEADLAWACMNTTQTAIKKALKKEPKLLDEVLKLAEVSAKTIFKGLKGGDQ